MIQLSNDPAVSVSYLYSGLFETQEEWSHPHRVIDSYEILYVVAGEVYLEEEGERFSLKAGDVYLLRPDCRHGGYRISRGKTSFYWVHFVTDGWPGWKPACCRCRIPIVFAAAQAASSHCQHTRLSRLRPRRRPGASACRADGRRQGWGERRGPLVSKIAEWVRIHSREKLTVGGVAARFGYHPDYLCVLFRKSLGMSLKAYIGGERVNSPKACF